MKKTLKALQMILISAVIAFTFCVVPVLADDPAAPASADEYTYTVRIYAGNQGSFGGGEVLEYTDLKAGDVVSFDFGSVTLKNSAKYYVSGIRESGKDNYDPAHPQVSAITVEGDADYVVAYGILGSSVAYTVNYVNTAGAPLIPADTHYGNVGDKPVIAFKYIDNYYPNAYNLTRTLSANAAENVFTFVYQSTLPAAAPEEEGAAEGGAAAGGAAAGGAAAPGAEGAAVPGGAAAPAAGGEVTPGGEVIPGGETPGTVTPGGELPSSPGEVPEIVDIDNQTAPQAGPGGDTTAETGETETIAPQPSGGLSGPAIAGIAAGGVVVAGGIAAIIVALAKRKKDK